MRLMTYDGEYFGAINLGNPVELTVRDLVTRVLRLTGSQSRVVNRPLPVDDPQRRRPDIALASKILGWSPRVALERGLRRTIAHFAREASEAVDAVGLPSALETRGHHIVQRVAS